jgi:tRNA (guanine37-N1)-methyltransferase
MNSEINGIAIDKIHGSNVIRILTSEQFIDNNFRIYQIDDLIIIPVSVNLHEIEDLNLGLDLNYKVYSFESKKVRPRSLKEGLINLVPEELHEFLPNAFDQIGNIAIIDIKKELAAYNQEIGSVLMKINQFLISVYRKSGKVDGERRVRGIELIAGQRITRTVHKEHGLRLAVDVQKTYFSPRLSTEHERIAKKIETGDEVLDLFGGVAPFAFHIVINSEAHVLSNDINPEVESLIKESLQLNRNLIRGSITYKIGDANNLGNQLIMEKKKFDHIIMNHPSNAHSYLKLAYKLIKQDGTIYLYIFAPVDNYAEFSENLIKSILTVVKIANIHIVRQSSPSEYHVCIELKKA